MPAPGQGQGEEVDDPQLLATIEQLCAVLGVRRPRVLASAQPGHAYGPGTLRLSTTALADYAPRDREAEHGVVTVRSSNASLRIRLHGWIQRIREEGYPERPQEELFELAG